MFIKFVLCCITEFEAPEVKTWTVFTVNCNDALSTTRVRQSRL